MNNPRFPGRHVALRSLARLLRLRRLSLDPFAKNGYAVGALTFALGLGVAMGSHFR